MKLTFSGGRLELGRVLAKLARPRGRRSLHINVSGQQANTLLHDGHAWDDFARSAPAATRRALRAAMAAKASMFVHASFAFVQAVERGATVAPPLGACVDAILECEALALAGPLPACVVRLGYLYGPASADLRAYRKAFDLGRPYWSGPDEARQYVVQQDDAATALLVAARPENAGRRFYATAGSAVSFLRFMDAFAHRVGRSTPLHLPQFSRPVAHIIIREEHMQQVALGMPSRAPSPQVPEWKPLYADYRRGLDEVVATWDSARR